MLRRYENVKYASELESLTKVVESMQARSPGRGENRLVPLGVEYTQRIRSLDPPDSY